MPASSRSPDRAVSRHAGWIAGAIVIVGVLAFGAAVWFMYHP